MCRPHSERRQKLPHESSFLFNLVPTSPHPPSISGMSQVCLLLTLLSLCSCTKVTFSLFTHTGFYFKVVVKLQEVSFSLQVSSANSLELVKEQWSSYRNQCLDFIDTTPPATGESWSLRRERLSEPDAGTCFTDLLSTAGLVCNRSFDLYACWPDGLPGTTVNVSCPWFLPWYQKGQFEFSVKRVGWWECEHLRSDLNRTKHE